MALAIVKMPDIRELAPVKVRLLMKKKVEKKKPAQKHQPVKKQVPPAQWPRRVERRVESKPQPEIKPPEPEKKQPDKPLETIKEEPRDIPTGDTVEEPEQTQPEHTVSVETDAPRKNEIQDKPAKPKPRPKPKPKPAPKPDPSPEPKPEPKPEPPPFNWGDYASCVVGGIQARKSYPAAARQQGVTGSVTVVFTVTTSGAITGASVSRSSGSGILDNAALGAVRGGPNCGSNPTGKTMSVTLTYSLK